MTICLKPYSDLIALATGNPSRLIMSSKADQIKPTNFSATKNVLITGANGFVGLHLVRELTAREEVSQVHAFVRASSDEAAFKRLVVAARRFGLSIQNQEKLKVYGATFSPADETPFTEKLANEIDAVIHAAGSTSHVKPYLYYRKESVLALVELMRFTQFRKQKSLHVIGSLGATIYSQLRDFFRLSFFHCGYSRMKWVTRRMTENAYALGLSTTMYLPSYIIGSACTDYRDPGMRYAFWQMLRLCNNLGMIWDSGDDAIAVVTGEDLAQKIVSNLLTESTGPCIYPSSCVNTKDIASRFQWEHVPWSEFYCALRKRYGLLKQGSLASLQDRMAARLLFPHNLPDLIRITSRSRDTTTSAKAMASVADTVFECAQKNYLFIR